jgi:hypothetical protein
MPDSHTSGDTDDNGLLTLAQKQGMNTEIRRSIFVVLMSSEVREHSTVCLYTQEYLFCRITSMLVSVFRS